MPVSPAQILAATILNGTALSNAIEVGSSRPVGLQVPVVTSAAITFQASFDGVTFFDAVDNAAAEITLGAATVGSKCFALPTTLGGFPFLKVRSGTSAAAVNQGADRILQLVAKGL